MNCPQCAPQVAAAPAVKQVMQNPPNQPSSPPVELPNCDIVHGLLERCLAGNELDVPLLPEVAVRVIRTDEELMIARSVIRILGLGAPLDVAAGRSGEAVVAMPESQ